MTEEKRQAYYARLGDKEGELPLPNGCTLYWKVNEVGGITYSSDEVGGGVLVWNTILVDEGTLLAAMAHYQAILYYNTVNQRTKK